MNRQTHLGFAHVWRLFSPEQVQVHNLPLGGSMKARDSSKVVYTLLHPTHFWPGGEQLSVRQTMFLMKLLRLFWGFFFPTF